MKKLILYFLLLLSVSCTTKYYVVRHAEKLNTSPNTPLSAAGMQRAQVLKDSLLPLRIDSIFATTFLRTQQTAQPLATALNKQLSIYSPSATDSLITHLKKLGGKNILIVGHSNTVPQIVQQLSGQSISPITETDFDNLYIVEIQKGLFKITKKLRQSTYGTPTN